MIVNQSPGQAGYGGPGSGKDELRPWSPRLPLLVFEMLVGRTVLSIYRKKLKLSSDDFDLGIKVAIQITNISSSFPGLQGVLSLPGVHGVF